MGGSAGFFQSACKAQETEAMTPPPEPRLDHIPFDNVKVTVTVAADPATAFAVFTEQTDLWWRRGPKFRVSGREPGLVSFELGMNGRLMETMETPTGIRVAVMGHITAWEPPRRFAFEWRGAKFAETDATTVEVLFETAGAGKTRVTVNQRGWATLRPDHPVRHGAEGPAFIRRTGLWWGELLTSLRERMAAWPRPRPQTSAQSSFAGNHF